MPEGDSIRRVANKLAPLVGQTIERATTQGIIRNLGGRTITHVDAHGKHLNIDLDNATQIHVHQGMNGRFRRWARVTGELHLAKTSPGRASLVIATKSDLCLWLTCPTVEITPRRAPMRGMSVNQLGPDVLAGNFDSRQAAERAALHPTRRIGDVLLDQRVVAGLGNIWKTESCFRARIDPRTRVADIPKHVLEQIYESAHELMANAVVVGTRDMAAYSNTNKPCPRCGALIICYQLGDPPRWTWSCPQCQPAPTDAADKR
ncbi:MAG TPA: DNA-formamidopyrimidine glycosylase family protein [Kofleriaceae bacterium]